MNELFVFLIGVIVGIPLGRICDMANKWREYQREAHDED